MYRLSFFLLVSLVAGASLEAQSTFRGSLSSQGSEFLVDSREAVLSPDGRYLAFTLRFSFGVQEIYVRDLIQGTTIVGSSSANGTPSNAWSRGPSFSGGGQLFAFESTSPTLVPGDTNAKADIFVKNLADGSITRVSVGPGGTESDQPSNAAAFSADGRYVAFESNATNLVPGFTTTTNSRIYRHDRQTGTTVAVSVTTSNAAPWGSISLHPSISADGRFVAFDSDAPDLVPGDLNAARDVFVRDVFMGTTALASVGATGVPGSDSQQAEISQDGALVAFSASPGSLGAWGLPSGSDSIVVKHLATGTVELIASAYGASDKTPRFSADSRFIAFASGDPTLVPGDTNGYVDVFVKDRLTGVISLVSVATDETQANAQSLVTSVTPGPYAGRYPLSISADGKFVAFTSLASNLVPSDTNGTTDAFVRDRSCNLVYTTFGQGSAGTGGNVPFLLGLEGPCSGGWGIVVANGRGGAQGVLAASVTRAVPAVPFAGGFAYLVMDPQLVLIPFTLSGPATAAGAGFWSLPSFNASFLAGLRIFHQAAIFDPLAVQGVALTNALQADF
jgi:Tol biopolymer transport system component